ncbi:hypothetical protein T265_05212 [Opisthorchis viverrini]|uniref:Uncharacterized protein n=1 Tax=Opisthorchis viverrini TaxID=6198 RepID=A0A074ZWY4_OPIVI|nr:hypothetical protein T265_05212 [Opisthorchis viverrini]KER27860.1 hypothetical protein T265_05212 [Opisthorchis viverrini]
MFGNKSDQSKQDPIHCGIWIKVIEQLFGQAAKCRPTTNKASKGHYTAHLTRSGSPLQEIDKEFNRKSGKVEEGGMSISSFGIRQQSNQKTIENPSHETTMKIRRRNEGRVGCSRYYGIIEKTTEQHDMRYMPSVDKKNECVKILVADWL